MLQSFDQFVQYPNRLVPYPTLGCGLVSKSWVWERCGPGGEDEDDVPIDCYRASISLSNIQISVGRGPNFGLRSWVWERCGLGGEDSQEFEIFIFGSKCPPTTATTITAIMTTIFFFNTATSKLTKERCCSFIGLHRLLHLCIKPLHNVHFG